MDQPRGATKVRDSSVGGGAGPTGSPFAAAATIRAAGATGGRDWVQPASISPSLDYDPIVLHVAQPASQEEPLHVLHQHGDCPLATPQEEGHLPAVQPAADVGDPHVGGGGPLSRAGDPRSKRVPSCAHAFGFHPHVIAAATRSADGGASGRASGTAATCAAAIGDRRAANTGVGAGTCAQLADQPAATTGTNAAASVAGHSGGQRE